MRWVIIQQPALDYVEHTKVPIANIHASLLLQQVREQARVKLRNFLEGQWCLGMLEKTVMCQ